MWLQSYLIGLPESITRCKKFPCPVCREECPAPNPQRPPADWAALLRTDFYLKNLILHIQTKATKKSQESAFVGASYDACEIHVDKVSLCLLSPADCSILRRSVIKLALSLSIFCCYQISGSVCQVPSSPSILFCMP